MNEYPLGDDAAGPENAAATDDGGAFDAEGQRPSPIRLAPGTDPPLRSRACPAHRVRFQSRVMQRLVQESIDFARSSATVLITGESGTGKEVFARLIHESSPRSGQRYERVNCAALAENLVESELFGHERGAFTGAVERRVGRFEWAAGGTLLLDEISEIPVTIQAKLLRVLEESEFQRIGNNTTQHCDVRIVATSNKDLADHVAQGAFRADLYYRLNVLRIQLPPLRQRREDIPLLALHFFEQFRREASVPLVGIHASAMKALCECDWPGNVRQLRNVVHRACIVAKQPRIETVDLPALEAPAAPSIPHWMASLKLDEVERELILYNLERFHGSRAKVAETLGLTAKTVTNKIKSYVERGIILPRAA
jgi:DNA-binding NtrC family response regulator